MYGGEIGPYKKPSKSKADFARERREKVSPVIKQGPLKSERIKRRATRLLIRRRFRCFHGVAHRYAFGVRVLQQ